MQRNTRYLAAALLAVAALAAGHALAQPAARAAVADPAAAAAAAAPGQHAHRAGRAARLARAVRDDPAAAVIVNLRAIERVYRHEGRSKDLPAFYREQLAKTQDPLVRNFVHYRLARLELRDDDAEAALEALRRNLEENYRRL
jgi:predicted negative regulator of RcsB-dependent stress response